MSTTHKFAMYVLDASDPGAFERRLFHMSTHKENAAALVKRGILTYGGPLLSSESIVSPTAEKKMVGSLMVYEADSLDAARKVVESDPFYTNGVWDKEKLLLFPFVQAGAL
ncbi:hypothetical protein BKA93DRAFT_735689 [Sparassis latifolia]|uniref:Fusaric acid biosynthesis protein n=1 Tax=Sparassis crispa TaxID=139825 RepID=A0A401GNN6_9APHY|nr:Fusaric acid biosynthesis protein [Sparassis crispa]GBE83851.1 Fusaric acid biosynthesis protein [Sparassis crispa]